VAEHDRRDYKSRERRCAASDCPVGVGGSRHGRLFVLKRPYAKPEAAARRLLEIASTIEDVVDGRIIVERVNLPFLREGGAPAEYRAGIERLKAEGLIDMHQSGAFFRFTEAGARALHDWDAGFAGPTASSMQTKSEKGPLRL
jgi:hypothetical protein